MGKFEVGVTLGSLAVFCGYKMVSVPVSPVWTAGSAQWGKVTQEITPLLKHSHARFSQLI